jgi:RimJ/RimL family protein N-acetyltransferase
MPFWAERGPETWNLSFPDEPMDAGPISLRPWRKADATCRVEASNDPLILEYTSVESDLTVAEAEEWIVKRDSDMADGISIFMAIQESESEKFLGSLGLIDFIWNEGRAEIGYWMLPNGRGTGRLSELLNRFSSWALESLPIARIDLFTNLDNFSSIRTAERAGYIQEGLLHSFKPGRNGREDLLLFGRVGSG